MLNNMIIIRVTGYWSYGIKFISRKVIGIAKNEHDITI